MAFNLFGNQKNNGSKDILTEELKIKPIPKRGPGGKFVSSKKEVESKKIDAAPNKKSNEKTQEPKKKSEGNSSQQPTTSTFYGKTVRRFYQEGNWYFSIDDVISLAAADSLNQKINLGDEKKLAEGRKKITKEFSYSDNSGNHTIETALAPDLIELSPYVRGIYPGPFRRWITETSNFPPPDKSDSATVPSVDESSKVQIHPSDTGNG